MSVFIAAHTPAIGPGVTEVALLAKLGNDHGGPWGPGVSSLE